MRSGFSLVELSIVLVILGLLTGGILTGQSLIRAAELRGVVSEYQNFLTATRTFQDKYFALPGDMKNATDFWGEVDPTPATCRITASTGKATCNGNGNGKIEFSAVSSPSSNEYYRFWQHLANAGLIEGAYTGIGFTGDLDYSKIGINVPRSRVSNGGWTTKWLGDWATTPTKVFHMNYGNVFYFGSEIVNEETYGKVLTPEEAWGIDKKVDDGRPASGSVIASFWDDECSEASTGTSAYDNLDAQYRLSDSSTQCSLIFRNAY